MSLLLKKAMPDDFGLLLEAIAIEWPAFD